MRDYKPDDGNRHCILTAGIRAAGIGRSAVKCNCHRLKYLLLYYKSVIALILSLTVYHIDILLRTIFLNISALLYYKVNWFKSVWLLMFFHPASLFFLAQMAKV
jgi:hypothetical protein